MNEDRIRILKMVSEGKLSAQEAATLLDALSTPQAPPVRPPESVVVSAVPRRVRYLYIKVTGPDTVDVRVPLGLVRAGMRLASLIPKPTLDHINCAMHDKGMKFDFGNIKPEDIEELIKNLGDMEINVKSKDGHDVRVFCGE